MDFNEIYKGADLLRKNNSQEKTEQTSNKTDEISWTDEYYCDIFADTIKNKEIDEHEMIKFDNFSSTSIYNKYFQKMLDDYKEDAFEKVINSNEWFGDISDVKIKADLKNGRVIFTYATTEGVDPDSCLRFTRGLISALSKKDLSIMDDDTVAEVGDIVRFAFDDDFYDDGKPHGAYTYVSTPDGYETERTYL